ncbi:MAG: hypothetical protein ACI9OJ_000307 [Myxococcota bacterium]
MSEVATVALSVGGLRLQPEQGVGDDALLLCGVGGPPTGVESLQGCRGRSVSPIMDKQGVTLYLRRTRHPDEESLSCACPKSYLPSAEKSTSQIPLPET